MPVSLIKMLPISCDKTTISTVLTSVIKIYYHCVVGIKGKGGVEGSCHQYCLTFSIGNNGIFPKKSRLISI